MYLPPLLEALGLAELTHGAPEQQDARHLTAAAPRRRGPPVDRISRCHPGFS